MTDKYLKVPDGEGGFHFIKSDKGTYSKDDLEKKEKELKKKLDDKEKLITERKQEAIYQEKRRQHFVEKQNKKKLIVISTFLIIFGSCFVAISNISNNSPNNEYIDPRDVLTPSERKEICYELYDTPDLRGELIACVAKVNAGS